MNATLAIIAVATLVGVWRARRRGWRDPAVWLQAVAALLLAATLLPPSIPVDGATLTVLTPGASADQRRALPWFAPLVATPGAEAPLRAEPVPDLATALRRHPQARVLHVVGRGLPPRDHGAVGARALQFDAAPETGIVALDVPSTVKLGTQIVLRGRAAAPAVRIALHDPGGAQVDVATLDGDGGFQLSAVARAAGTVTFELRAFDAADAPLDRASVPLVIETGERLRVRFRAGTPDADAKYWRRWAQDAGISVAYRAGLSEGVALAADDAALTPAALADSDLVIVDERAWLLLAGDEKAALLAAVDDGLGLLLKVTGALEPAVAADWAALGYATTALAAPATVTLDRRLATRARAGYTAAPVAIAPAPDAAPDITPLLQADDATLLAGWRARGAGRIAIWRLLDSYRLVLAGDAARHGALWSDALAEISRPLPPPAAGPRLPREAWVDERAVLCGLGQAARLLTPDGASVALSVRGDGCAAAWPGASGWHRVQTGAASWPLYVRAEDDAAGLRAMRDREATRQLLRLPDARPSPAGIDARLPRWPWFLGWLALAGLLWWRERRA